MAFNILIGHDRIALVRVLASPLSDKLPTKQFHRASRLKLTGHIGGDSRSRTGLFLLSREVAGSLISARFKPQGAVCNCGNAVSLSLGATIRCGLGSTSTNRRSTLSGGSARVRADLGNQIAMLGSADLPNRKLAVNFLLRQFSLIPKSLPLIRANLTKLLTIRLDRRGRTFANRTSKARVARASNPKASLNKRHVQRLTTTSGRINAILLHPLTQRSHRVRK
jgi:hypothetical protein